MISIFEIFGMSSLFYFTKNVTQVRWRHVGVEIIAALLLESVHVHETKRNKIASWNDASKTRRTPQQDRTGNFSAKKGETLNGW